LDGGSVSTTFQVIGPRVTPLARSRAFEAELSKHVSKVLALPGWLAAPRYHLATRPPGGALPRLTFTKLW
jgi:hypothetical protein